MLLGREPVAERVQRGASRVVRGGRLREEERRGGVGEQHADDREEACLAEERALPPACPGIARQCVRIGIRIGDGMSMRLR